MKFKLLLTTAFISLASILVKAEDVSTFSIKGSDNNSFSVQLQNVKNPEIKVSFKDSKGYTLYDETVMQSSLNQKRFNIKDLPTGKYTLIVAYDNIIKIQPIVKSYKAIEIKAEDANTIYEPVFRQHSDYLDINMLCLNKLKYSLSITDNEGHVIYSATTDPNKSLQKRFNLSSLTSGSYTFGIEVNENGMHKEFNKTINWSPLMAES
jgi:hypothetical protein